MDQIEGKIDDETNKMEVLLVNHENNQVVHEKRIFTTTESPIRTIRISNTPSTFDLIYMYMKRPESRFSVSSIRSTI